VVVKSSVIKITVAAPAPPAPPAPPTLKVTRVYITASRTSITAGESVMITGRASLDRAVPSGYKAYVELNLMYRDPDGKIGSAGKKTSTATAGYSMTGTVGWTVTLEKPGTWEFWIEAPDTAELIPAGMTGGYH